jgi:hypothetical protein
MRDARRAREYLEDVGCLPNWHGVTSSSRTILRLKYVTLWPVGAGQYSGVQHHHTAESVRGLDKAQGLPC